MEKKPDGLSNAVTSAAGKNFAGDVSSSYKLEAVSTQDESRWFHLIAQVSPVLIWVSNKTGRIVFGNHACCDFLGLTSQQLSDEPNWTHFIHPDDYDAYTQTYREAIAAKKAFVGEARVKRADGQWRYLATYASPYYTDDGEFAGFVGSSPDVTERVEWDRRLLEADRAKNQFLAMLAHELRNPLAPIVTSVSILKRLGALPDMQQRAVDIISRQATHLTRLVEDLVDVQRIANNKISMRWERLALADVLSSAVEASQPNLERRRQLFDIELPLEPLHVQGDALRLAQVFTNLINNAAKFSPEDTRIELRASALGRQAVVRVRDYGMGIEPNELTRIFDVFVQVTGADDRAHAGGLGLGLALAKGLVELHGGSIEARSAGRGRGCEMTVRLPLVD
jgi:two-component system CheB/CheR fusion protein